MNMRTEKTLYGALYLVLGALWLKLAYDLNFDFGPESARAWFPHYAVASISAFSLFLVALNGHFLFSLARLQPATRLTEMKKSLIIAAFLAGIFSCWSAGTLMKVLDMYLIIPAIILFVSAVPHDSLAPKARYLLLLLSVPLLIPNDTCENPQNRWWVCSMGASPLTYILPVNVLLPLISSKPSRSTLAVLLIVVALYYLACVFHRLEGY